MTKNQDLKPALDAAQNQLRLTFSASDSLDSKAMAILGYDVAIGIFALQSEQHNQWWLLIPLFLLLGLSLLINISSILPQDYVGALVDLDKHPEYFQLDAQGLIAQLLADTQEAIARNSDQNIKKSRYNLAAIITSLLATGLLVGCIM